MNQRPECRCPTCGSLDLRRSHSKRMLDYLMAARHKRPVRCRHCGRRFYRPDAPAPAEPGNEGTGTL